MARLSSILLKPKAKSVFADQMGKGRQSPAIGNGIDYVNVYVVYMIYGNGREHIGAYLFYAIIVNCRATVNTR